MGEVKKATNSSDGSVSYEEAIELAGFGKLHYMVTFVGGFSLFISLIASIDITYILPAAECELKLEKKDRGILSGAYFIGVVVSSHLLGFLSDTLGRRYILVRALFLNIIIYIISSLSPNYWSLLIIRFLTGIVLCGVTTCSFVYTGEFHSNKHRSRALMLISAIATNSYIYCAGVGGWILPGEWAIQIFNGYFLSPWRVYYFLIGVIPSAVIGSVIFFLPESPKYFLACSKKDEALEVLRQVYRINTGNPSEQYPVKNLQLNPNEQVSQLTGKTKSPTAVIQVIWNQTYPLFVPPHLLNMLFSFMMLFCLFFLLAGVLIWIPDVTNQLLILKNHRSEKGPVDFCQLVQSNWTENIARKDMQLLSSLNVSSVNSKAEVGNILCKPTLKTSMFEINALIGVILFISTTVVSFTMKRFNRKVFVSTVYLVLLCIALLLLYIPNVYFIMVAQGTIIILLNLTFCGISTLLVDYYPTNLRAMAIGLSIMVGRFGSAVGGHIFSLFLLSNCSSMYYISSGLMFLAALCCICLRSPFKNTVSNVNVAV